MEREYQPHGVIMGTGEPHTISKHSKQHATMENSRKKWSIGRLFRKNKKGVETNSSSEEDRKAGFVRDQNYKSHKNNNSNNNNNNQRGSKYVNTGHMDNEFFLPIETITPHEQQQQQQQQAHQQFPPVRNSRLMSAFEQRNNAMSKRSASTAKCRSAQRASPTAVSSNEELISIDSTTFSKYRSDESIHSGGMAQQGVGNTNRRSRAARNERYYKRLSRDGEISAAPLPPMQQQYVPSQVAEPYMQWHQLQQLECKKQAPYAVMSDKKRSISYDSHLHLQNINGRMQTKPLPPPPPPRDPLRRVQNNGQAMHTNNSAGDLRPLSYAFDAARCVSDDKIWSANNVQRPQSRRFITRAERAAQPSKQSLPNGIEFNYVADAAPCSRKPIQLVEHEARVLRNSRTGLPSSGGNNWRASDFWKRLEASGAQQQRHFVEKPRSMSSSRVSELRSYPIYSDTDNSNIVCGSLHIKRANDNANNYVEIRHNNNNNNKSMINNNNKNNNNNDVMNKSSSMPNHYNRSKADEGKLALCNKYDQYIADKRRQEKEKKKQLMEHAPPAPPQRKLSIPFQMPRKKPTNLEEAIIELEAIYASLGLTEPLDGNPAPQESANNVDAHEFDSYALAHANEYDDEDDSPAGEPDPVRDDVAYRNIKLGNLQHKNHEKQLPFGMPIGPIVQAPHTDYLHVEKVTDAVNKPHNIPDIVKDDLAVRTLRKDPLQSKDVPRIAYPSMSTSVLNKKNRATRTQSANIYSLMQRDAAKPSGGDIYSYMELSKNIDRCGSMSDIRNADIPSSLKFLLNYKEQEKQNNMANEPLIIVEQPQTTAKTAPVPMQRKSLTFEPVCLNNRMEDALNKIAKDAQESSMKLSRELQEMRKEALITHSRSKINASEEENLAKDLQEIEAISEAAKRCGQLLLESLPDATSDAVEDTQKQRNLATGGTLISEIDKVSEAANAVCDKILKDIGTECQYTPDNKGLVMPNLIRQLDAIQPEKTEIIAERCMRQIGELVANLDYDNLPPNADNVKSSICTNNNKTPALISDADDTLISTVAEANLNKPQEPSQQHTSAVDKNYYERQSSIEEIDQIIKECEAQVQQSHEENNTNATQPLLISCEFHAPSTTSSVRTFSTASKCVTPNITKSTFSYLPTPTKNKALNSDSKATTTTSKTESEMTLEIRRRSSSSQYNSSEELAMIFGIKDKRSTSASPTKFSGNVEVVEQELPTPNPALSSPATNTNNNKNNNNPALFKNNNNQCQSQLPKIINNNNNSILTINRNGNYCKPLKPHSNCELFMMIIVIFLVLFRASSVTLLLVLILILIVAYVQLLLPCRKSLLSKDNIKVVPLK